MCSAVLRFSIKGLFLGTLLYLSTGLELTAQSITTDKPIAGDWSFLAEPYLMFPAMDGTVGMRNLPDAPVDASASDIFSSLKMGFMLNLEAYNDNWVIGSDLLYMHIGQDMESGIFIESGEITAKQLGWELYGLYRVRPWLEFGLGGLVNSINTELKINRRELGGGTIPVKASKTETWFDPMLIGRIKNREGQKFLYQFRAEIGGFGIGSDLAWEIQAYAGYRFSDLFQMTGGYRVIGLDFETGSGSDRFMYDVDTSGPVIRLGFNF